GIVTLDVTLGSGAPAIGYEPLGDFYNDLISFIESAGATADQFARATLLSGQFLGSPNTEVEGTFLHEDLVGGRNADTLDGGAGDDRIYGHEGADRLIDGAGKDNLTGGAGADVFVLSADGQADAIKDFEVGVDRIDISDWGVTAFADLKVFTHASGKSILRYADEAASINDGAWTLAADQLTADSFIFAGSGALVALTGTGGNDKLIGTGAAEAISDFSGVDNLWGRGGADVFVMAADGQSDSIKDFQDGRDRIDLSAWGVTEFSDLTLSTHASGKTILRYGSEALSINDGAWTLPASSFSAEDFIFA
ncbi:MAG: M10 family metallopeptidase C-terminal domain-containing protein, partial [Pseudomonadota bacterium]